MGRWSFSKFIRRVEDAGRASIEQWVIECCGCGKSVPALEHGVIRIGAWSKGKRIRVRCTTCKRTRWARLIKDPERAHELRIAAYEQELESHGHQPPG